LELLGRSFSEQYNELHHVYGALHVFAPGSGTGKVSLRSTPAPINSAYDIDLLIRFGLFDESPGDLRYNALFFGLCENDLATPGNDPGLPGVWLRTYPMTNLIELRGRDDGGVFASATTENIGSVSDTMRYFKIEIRNAWTEAELLGSQDGVSWVSIGTVTATIGDFYTQDMLLQIVVLNNSGSQVDGIETVIDFVQLIGTEARDA
jgi:hypothetical protein